MGRNGWIVNAVLSARPAYPACPALSFSLPVTRREREFSQRADRDAAWTFWKIGLVLLRPRGSGDVHVHPRQAAGELLQEQRGRNRACRTATRVEQIRDLAADLIAVLVEQRQRPHAIASAVRDATDE